MLKFDLKSARKELAATTIYAAFLFFIAQVAIFLEFPDHPWAFQFTLLYLGQMGFVLQQSAELREKAQARRFWVSQLGNRLAMTALHQGEREHYQSDNEFWGEINERASEEVSHEDATREAGADLDGERKPKIVWKLLGKSLEFIMSLALAGVVASVVRG